MSGKFNVKKLVSILLIVVMMLGNALTVQAASPSLSTSTYMKTYVLSTANNTYVYTTSDLKTRGTSSPKRAYNATIYAGDEIYVYTMTSSYCYISYPTTSGRKYGYIKTSAITANNYSKSAVTSKGKFTTYRRAGATSYGSVAKGDKVYTIGSSGSWKQIIYPVGKLWKMGWCSDADYNKYIAGGYNPQGCLDSVTCTENNKITVTGWAFDRDNLKSQLAIHVYVGGPAGSGAPGYAITANSYRPDVNNTYSGVGKYHGFNSSITVSKTGSQTVYVYAINVGSGQNTLIGKKTVNISGSSGSTGSSNTITAGKYVITSALNDSYAVDVSNNNTDNGTNIQLYQKSSDNMAQIFNIESAGNGYYKIVHGYSGKVFDVEGGIAQSGVNVQLYEWNGTNAQLWKFVSDGNGYYYIKNKLGYYLDVASGTVMNGQNIWVYTGNKSSAQKFKLNAYTGSSSTTNWDSLVGKTVANIGSKYYTTDNMSYNAGYKGQCTWYAYGRFYEVTGIKLEKARHAKYWLSDNASNSKVTVTNSASAIKAKTIAVRTSGQYGHVMFVENVTYNSNGSPAYVYFTECNADGNGVYDVGTDCIVKKLTYASFINSKNPTGYISAR